MNERHSIKFPNNQYFEVILGPAGTGKTFIPIVDAAYKLRKNEIKKIILTRPIVEAEEKIGFLPGDIIKSGLRQAMETLREVKNVTVIEFDSADIVRHPIVQEIVDHYDDYEWVEQK